MKTWDFNTQDGKEEKRSNEQLGADLLSIAKITAAAFLMPFARPYTDMARQEADIQDRINQLEALGVKDDVIGHIVQRARVAGYTTDESSHAATLRILDDCIYAVKLTEKAAATTLLDRLTR